MDSGKQELLQVMQRCKAEIQMLRKLISVLEPKADAYDKLSIVLGLLRQPSQGMGEDLIWRLEKRIEELLAALVADNEGGG